MSAVAAIVLAAGTSSRYRRADAAIPTKLVADLHGLPLVRHVVSAALGSRARPVVVVTGHAELDVRHALEGLDVSFVHNPDFADGLSTSLRSGLTALPAQTRGALVLLGDMPTIHSVLLGRLIDAFERGHGVDAVVPVQGGRRGNPALLGRNLFAAAATLVGDEGARRLLSRAHVLELPVFGDAISLDVDDPEALRRLRAGRA